MNPENFFLGNKRRSLMMSEMGKFPSLVSPREAGENGVAGGDEEHVAGACGGVVEGDGRMRGHLGCPVVDRALTQHLIHCECLLQVSLLVYIHVLYMYMYFASTCTLHVNVLSTCRAIN